eukprot:Gregarina_sp_Poly_1__3412@NODE_198_length_11566_cov_244_091399_g177_i0_p1_GENE_NODE_198_length_11566_cov_244_091399_g177_i0NODE_198_length_11566_cov_244_091399_g177_i0_p1_ORF_typecomplete_len706_score133_85INCENP_ARKbind/PF03941_15/3_7e03INCENP_ARKbind/PF03941_15/6_4e02INCENP_ARKbind/PF03941_15/0_00015COMMD1_N/PF17221_3/1_4COMMD1_N/PF17221_3/1e03COMMD1_N/PF17221_3/1_8e04_NODE_198_length_11566_cov_244_091399_g177_i0940511522
MSLSQTPEVEKPVAEDEFIGQVAGLSMKTILAACTALESLTDDIQKGMTKLKDRALVEYRQILSKIESENPDWVQFAQFIREQQNKAAAETRKDNAVQAVARVFEQEQLRVVAKQAFDLELAWGETCIQAGNYSPDSSAIQISKKRPRATFEQTPLSQQGGRLRGRSTVKMTPKLASCAKRFAEELSTMRRVDSRRNSQQSGFVLLSADASSKMSSFRLSSVLGATTSRQETEPLKDKSEDIARWPDSERQSSRRYTFGQSALGEEDWQDTHEELSCEGSLPRDPGLAMTVEEEEGGSSPVSSEAVFDDTEGDDGTEDEDDDDVRISIEEGDWASKTAEAAVSICEPNSLHIEPSTLSDPYLTQHSSEAAASEVDSPPSDPAADQLMSDGEQEALAEGVEDGSDKDDGLDDEMTPASSCDSEENGTGSQTKKSPVSVSGFMPTAVGILKTPLVRIQEKLGAFSRLKGPQSEQIVSRKLYTDSRKIMTAQIPSADENGQSATLMASPEPPPLVPPETTQASDSDNKSLPSKEGPQSYHRFLKPLGPKNPLHSADISGVDQGFEPRPWVDQASWAKGDSWQREVKRQSKWNPHSLFGCGVKAAQFTDVFQTPDFRRATSNARSQVPEKTDGRISRMNRWEVDKLACAFNESEGMTQQQLAKMISLLNKTEDISDLAYEPIWLKCTSDCNHDIGKKQPWHKEDLAAVE